MAFSPTQQSGDAVPFPFLATGAQKGSWRWAPDPGSWEGGSFWSKAPFPVALKGGKALIPFRTEPRREVWGGPIPVPHLTMRQ